MSIASPEVWSRLRATRASPPGRASSTGARKRTYAAAMQQFEELMAAAKVVGVPARPLTLFYALSQAGRAIAAAHATEPWKLRGHGLRLQDENKPLLQRHIAPDGKADASFRRVAEATGSDVLEEPVTVSALCASLPELASNPDLCGANPRALFVKPIAQSLGPVLTTNPNVDAYVFNLPAEVESATDLGLSLDAHLRNYPSAVGWTLPEQIRQFPPRDGWGPGVVVRWHVSAGMTSANETDRRARIREVAPQYRYVDQQWCRPSLTPGKMLTPLMTWWALLFALSMVARYEPDTWVNLLGVDESPLAVPLEGLLEGALGVVPHIVLDALQMTPLLLRPTTIHQA